MSDREPRTEHPPTPVPRLLRLGLHVLVGALLALTVAMALGGDHAPAVVAGSVVVGTTYAVGPRSTAVARSRRAAQAWLAALVVVWLVLLALTPAAIYLAFPWFFLLLHLLSPRVGLAAVGLVTVAAVGGFAWHAGTFAPAMAIGPLLGALVVIATVWGYQALQAESEARRRLIVELERTRSDLAAAERQAGVLGERERLAREIHDTLAQGLSSIQLLLRAAGRSLDGQRALEPDRAASLVEQARVTAQDNLVEARRFVHALAPPDLTTSSLTAALDRLCATTSARSGLVVSFHHVGPEVSLPTAVEVALLRIAQSALGNTARHAGARRADVTLTVMDEAVTLDVVDDGAGFDLAAAEVPPRESGGFGLTSMRSRVAELGGRLTVEAEPGRGTAVCVHLDLPATVGDTAHEVSGR